MAAAGQQREMGHFHFLFGTFNRQQRIMMKVVFAFLIVLELPKHIAGLPRCGERESCRVVEYRPVIPEDTSSGLQALELQSSGASEAGPIAELDYGDGLANEVPTVFPYEEATYFVESHQICECPDGSQCPDENSTDTERSIRLDTFTELKLCAPKIRYPVCRDFRRPVVRVFKEIIDNDDIDQYPSYPQPSASVQSHNTNNNYNNNHNPNNNNNNQPPPTSQMRYVKAPVWCRCESGRFGKSRNVEVWMNGRQHAFPYLCSRNRSR